MHVSAICATLCSNSTLTRPITILFPSLLDLSSNVIPFDDDEDEDEEETYDDIEEVGRVRQSQPAQASQDSQQGGEQNTEEAEEGEDDIYEVLPGTRMQLPHMVLNQTNTHLL